MTVIKNLAFLDKQKLKMLSPFIESELDLLAFYPFPVDFFHHFLPFKLKFLNETFVAIDNKKIAGLITVNKVSEKRLKISRLLLEEKSLEIGKLLTNCVITMFLSKGAETFYIVIDKKDTNLIKLFKEALSFQSYAKEFIYKIENKKNTLNFKEMNFGHIKRATVFNAKEIKNFVNGAMNSFSRPVFYIKSSDVQKRFIFEPNSQFIVFDGANNKILGYFTISQLKNGNYLLDFALDAGYEGYITDIVEFSYAKLLKQKNFKALYIKLKSYYSNFKELKENLNIEYENVSENDILVKGFMAAKKQEFSYGKMIFNDITPAY